MSVPARPGRSVELVLTTKAGELLGALSPFDVPEPWWMEAGGIVGGARAAHGIDVTVLRLLDTHGRSFGDGGPVTYLAEVAEGSRPEGLRPWTGPDPLEDQPMRLPYARPGGPDADLDWADGMLLARGERRTGPARQERTWNLSSVWQLSTDGGDAWLKVVPPFFAHEGSMLARLGTDHPGLAPELLGSEGCRMLLRHVPGGDNYEANLPVLVELVRTLVALQAEWAGRVGELLALGAPDWRAEALTAAADRAVRRTADQLDAATIATLARLVDGLPDRFAALAECGILDTLVHGDFHPGNSVGAVNRLVILDWGDCGAGNPLLDQAAFTSRLSGPDQQAVLDEWARCWREAAPGCDPERAARLVRPVAAMRQAVVYWSFLDGIEPEEWVYHASDPADWLRRAARFAGEG